MSTIDHFLEIFDLAARQAGYVARHLQEEISLRSKKGQKSSEGEALTAIDLAVQDVILTLLHSEFADIAIDTDEKTETVDLFGPSSPGKPLIVVDPIDGTLNSGRGSQEYARMAAWLEEERYQASLVHFPAAWKTYQARRGDGCWTGGTFGDRMIKIGTLPQRVLVTPAVPDNYHKALRNIGFEVVVSRCSALEATAPITGTAAAALSLGRPGRRRAVGFLLTKDARVLEIGTGSGYAAAILSRIAAEVYTIECRCICAAPAGGFPDGLRGLKRFPAGTGHRYGVCSRNRTSKPLFLRRAAAAA